MDIILDKYDKDEIRKRFPDVSEDDMRIAATRACNGMCDTLWSIIYDKIDSLKEK